MNNEGVLGKNFDGRLLMRRKRKHIIYGHTAKDYFGTDFGFDLMLESLALIPVYSGPVLQEFKINEFITLKLIGSNSVIFIKDRPFKTCKYLLLNIPVKKIKSLDKIDSIDEAAEILNRSMEFPREPFHFVIPPETEFWGHCSNLQVWYENNYDTRILHRGLAFPLLKSLTEAGDSKAKEVIKEEIATRFCSGYFNVMVYLVEEDYLYLLNRTEQETIAYSLGFNKDFFEESKDTVIKRLRKFRNIPQINEGLNGYLSNFRLQFMMYPLIRSLIIELSEEEMEVLIHNTDFNKFEKSLLLKLLSFIDSLSENKNSISLRRNIINNIKEYIK